ncbi:MAG: ribonuclease III [Alphaproteobacteria bacterium]|nr:ribonuclease III [Alphaproteobacteria bacterium]
MKEIGYEFKNKSLLELALTQSGANSAYNNERLEFIGDRVLGLSVADLLMDMYPSETEGELARRHAVLVSTDTLGDLAAELGINKRVRHGHMTAGRTKHMLANTIEAIFGAIYLDGGFEVARSVIIKLWRDLAARDIVAPKDAKTALQELVQQQTNGQLPVYEFNSGIGESHNPVFSVRVTAMGQSAVASGDSKKAASTAAAAELLKMLAKSGQGN